MSTVRWVLSLLIAYHLAALTAAAIPAPDALPFPSEIRHPSNDSIAAAVTPVLDGAARSLSRLEPILFQLSAPVRSLTRVYSEAGLGGQQWNMFSTPYTVDKYVRLDYYVVRDADPLRPRLLRELALPADDEARVRLLHQFRDKVMLNTLDNYFKEVAAASASGGEPFEPEAARRLRGLEPIVRYFASRLVRTLRPGERLVRTELWNGEAPIPPPDQGWEREMRTVRLAALAPFRQGPAPVAASEVTRYQQRGAMEREADIRWLLVYVTPTAPGGASSVR
jgi:hypothetical protein